MSLQREIDQSWRAAWKLPDKLTPSEWAERHRILGSAESAEPGPWRNARTPYLAGLMDAVTEPGVEEITFVKSTQVGGSEALRNILGYWIEEDPGPCLIVMPSEQAVKEMVEERIKPLILTSPSLRRHWSGDPHDMTLVSVKLDTMPIYFGWAGSPQSLASRPCRFVIFDECDKFPAFAGREADPISLGMERTATYGHRRKVLKISTPTTREGAIWRAWEASGDRRHFHVPCPHCGAYQELAWQQVKWPKLDIADKIKRADVIEQGRLAWYECRQCKQRIDDHHKPKMLLGGRWVRDDGCEASKRVALHLDSIYSPWRRFATEAADFIRAEGDPGAAMNVTNSRRAMPFDNLVTQTRPSVIREKSLGAPPARVIPKWAQLIVSTVDTQKDWFKVHVGAWGWGFRYQLVYEGVCQTFDEAYRIGLQSAFDVEGGGQATPSHQLIDTGGNRTDEVYQYALRDPGKIIPCKGASHSMRRPWAISQLPSGVSLRMIDTNYFKDMLARLIYDPDPTKWMPHRDVSEQYCMEMAAEHKIIDRKNGRLMWVPKSSGARVESWDCEVLMCAAADMANLGAMPAEPTSPTPAPVPDPEPYNPLSYKGRW